MTVVGAARSAGRSVLRVGATVGARVRRATGAHGARESGLSKLIELHAVNAFGDMLVTVALASTVFFSVPTDQARGRVALYLLVTMAPFAVLAPVIGPLLDRVPHGRRAAIAVSMLVRAVLGLTMAGTGTVSGGLALYPAALGVLVASKAYGVVRSAAVPRLLPSRITLVKANSRVTLAGLVATGFGAAVGGGLHLLGSGWPLRGACVVFVVGAWLAFRLPGKVDSARGEERARLTLEEPDEDACPEAGPGGGPGTGADPGTGAARGRGPDGDARTGPTEPTARTGPTARDGKRRDGKARDGAAGRSGLRNVGPSVVLALQATTALRWLSGFLTLFLAFLLRSHPVGGLRPTLALGLVAVAAGTGNALGAALGAWLKARAPEAIVTALLGVALGAAVLAAVRYDAVTMVTVAAVAGLAQSLGKLSLDALIQRDVPERVQTSAFARSETLMQLGWVVGGGVGIALPLRGEPGLAVAAAVLGAVLLLVLRLAGPARRHRGEPGRAGPGRRVR